MPDKNQNLINRYAGFTSIKNHPCDFIVFAILNSFVDYEICQPIASIFSFCAEHPSDAKFVIECSIDAEGLFLQRISNVCSFRKLVEKCV